MSGQWPENGQNAISSIASCPSKLEPRFSPRPVGFWQVTHPVGGRIIPPRDLPNNWTYVGIYKIQQPFDSLVRKLSKHGEKIGLEITDDVTGQVKVGMLDISDFVTLASKISMLSANKANESAWIMSLAFVSLHVLCDHNTGQGHLRSPGKKGQAKKFGM